MTDQYIACLGDYNFTHIAKYAKKRYIEGVNTITLLSQANSEREREEIALVCLLDIEDNEVKNLKLTCRYANDCKIENCREILRNLIQEMSGSQSASPAGA